MSVERFDSSRLVLSENYAGTMDQVVLPWLYRRRRDFSLPGAQGKPLPVSCYAAEAPRGTVLLVHGFTENGEKYAELIHSLLKNRLSAVIWDQRGHGRAWRDPEIDDLSLTHVDDFEAYVEDMAAVCDRVMGEMPGPWYLFGHSMGGAVAALYLERRPGAFERAVLCAPMIAPNLMGIPRGVVRALCAGASILGWEKRRTFVTKPYVPPEPFETAAASGRERFEWYEGIRAKTPLYQNNGPTYGWTGAALRACRQLMAPGAVEKIDVPLRLYTAGEDRSVLPGPQIAFVERLRHGERILVPGARHEIYRSTDAVLFPWWRGVLDYWLG